MAKEKELKSRARNHITRVLGMKLAIVRESLDEPGSEDRPRPMTQVSAAKLGGWNQTNLSASELAKVAYIPVSYIEFLARRGINLTALFNEDVTPFDFRQICAERSGRTLTLIEHPPTPCILCAEKDREITHLNMVIDSNRDTISTQKQTIELLSGAYTQGRAANG